MFCFSFQLWLTLIGTVPVFSYVLVLVLKNDVEYITERKEKMKLNHVASAFMICLGCFFQQGKVERGRDRERERGSVCVCVKCRFKAFLVSENKLLGCNRCKNLNSEAEPSELRILHLLHSRSLFTDTKKSLELASQTLDI